MFDIVRRQSLRRFAPLGIAALLAIPAVALIAGTGSIAAEQAVPVPPPSMAEPVAAGGLETIVLAGGCFWGVQGVFQHVNGVESAVSGYAGGTVKTPSYEEVSSGTTGHAESVEIKFDPAKVSAGKLLQIFFSVAHNPTELNYQGPDQGTQYRSAIFVTTDDQKKLAEAYIAELGKAKVFDGPIVTEVTPLNAFFPAEDYHQDYATLHPEQGYIAYNDLPKIANLKAMFPDVWRDQPKLVFASNAT